MREALLLEFMREAVYQKGAGRVFMRRTLYGLHGFTRVNLKSVTGYAYLVQYIVLQYNVPGRGASFWSTIVLCIILLVL
jgi:hypothetical protein